MLNISNYKVEEAILNQKPTSFSKVTNHKGAKVLVYWLVAVFSVLFIVLFLPWTQNVRSKGKITTINPQQRPQDIPSIIAGRIEKWYVREGQYVDKGDTIITISEIKPDYLSPELIPRIKEQLANKVVAIKSYKEKINSLIRQQEAIEKVKNTKYAQARNKYAQAFAKLQSDSASYLAAKTNYDIALKQLERQKTLYDQGLKSLTELEEKKQKLQESNAKIVSAENKLFISKNELINAKIEYDVIIATYNEKMAKSQSDLSSAESMLFNAEVEVSKLRIKLSNTETRNSNYAILAPQDCFIQKVKVPGVGQVVKEGKAIVSIMPADYELAVELYINPVDYPLMHKGEHVRIVFDGYPAIVFSGWPGASYNTYGGEIIAIDQHISDNGKFRVLVAHQENDVPWPEQLRVGSGAEGMALLNDVFVVYELWRKLSQFPPEYYTAINKDEEYKRSNEYKKTKGKK